MAIFMELLDIIVMFFYETLSNVLKRGYFREFAVTVKHVLLVELFSVLYLFTMQEGQAYSRTALYLTGVIYAILTYIVRIIWKKILRSRMSEGNRSLLVVTTKDMAEQVVHNIRENNYERFALSGLVIIDDDLCGTKIAGVPVVANEENAAAYVCRGVDRRGICHSGNQCSLSVCSDGTVYGSGCDGTSEPGESFRGDGR